MRRSIAVLLCILLVLSLFPVNALASDNDCIFTVEGIPESIAYSIKAVYTDDDEETEDFPVTDGQFPLTVSNGDRYFYRLIFTLAKVEGFELKNMVFKDYNLSADNSFIDFSDANIWATMELSETAQNYTISIDCAEAYEEDCIPVAQYINGSRFIFSIVEKEADPGTASAKAIPDEEWKDNISTAYYGKDEDGADKWKVSADIIPDAQSFDYWGAATEDGNPYDLGGHEKENPLKLSLKQTVVFTPHFKPMDISLLGNFKLNEIYVEADPNNGQVTPKIVQNQTPGLFSSLITDSSCICYLAFSLPNSLPENDTAKFVVRLYSGDSVNESKALGRTEFIVSKLNAGNHYFQMRLDDIPNDMTQITAAVDFSSDAGVRETQTRTYDLPATILSTRKGDALRYVENATGYITMAAAGVDDVTGQLNLVMSNGSGLFTLEKGSLSFTSCDVSGLHQLSQVKALASADDGTVWAYIASTSKEDLPALSAGITYSEGYTPNVGHLAVYDGETWRLVEDSTIYNLNENTESKLATCNAADLGAIIPLKDSVVVAKNKTWTGSEWTDGGHGKDKLIQMDGKTYAADSKGVYVYDADNRTWQTLTTEVTAGQYDQLNAANGKLSISANSGNSTSPRYTQMTILSIDSKTTEKVDTTIFGTGGAVYLTINSTGLSYEGVPYYYYSGPIFNNNQDRMTVLCRYEGEGEDAAWIRVKESAFWSDAENPNQFATKVRPASVDVCMNPAVGVTLHGQSYGHTISSSGSLYLETASTTITFDANGGTLNGAESVTGQIYSEIPVSVQTTAARDGYVFSGWSYDTEGKTTWTSNDTVFPAKDITLYAKWIDPSEVDDPLAYHRQSALESLKRQYEKYSKSDYSEENWAKLEQAYQDGIKAINEAPAADGKYIEDNIIAELNKALQAMGAIKPDRAGKIDIIVSLDAQTLGLGYYIDPTIVTVDKYTQASYVITDLIKQTIKEKFKMDLEGATVYHVSEPDVDPPYAYMMTGTEANSFYLAQVYWPDQTKAQVAKYIQNYADWTTDGYKDGKYLGEFDYCDKSGWMYSIADRTTGNPSFPGVGAADWRLSDGEVMRWQFTVWGYGADLAADNSEWGQPSIAYKDDGTAAGDKTALTVMVAELRQVYGDKLLRNNRTYFEIHRDVLCNPLATQEELDAAVAKRSQIEEELKDAYAAENAKDLIEAIGTVTLGRKAAIEAARAAYNALTEEQLAIFNELYPDHLKILTDAEARYEELKKQAEQEEIDKAAAQEVIKLIDDIGGVESVTGSSGPKIRKARAAYDALTDAQKKYVTNYDVLVACEEAFDAIPNPVPTPVIPSTPSKPKDDKPTTGSTFADVPSGSWYEDAVKYVSEKGLMNGTSRNGFSPNATTTRGMIVTILARVEGVNTNGTPWYAAGQKWAMDNGISDGTNMVGEVTREQLAAILYRYAKLKGYDTSKSNKLDSFKDADKVSSWAVEAMQWANAEGLINGKNNSMLDPQGKATRAETAAILMRFMQNIAK